MRFLRVFSAFFYLNFPQRVCSFQAPYWFCIFTFEVFLFLSCFSASFFIIRGVIGIFLFYWWGLCSFFCLFRGWKWVVSWPSSSRQLQSHVCSWEDVCLSTVSEEDLTSSLGALSTGGTIPPPHDFVDRFCRKRANYFRTKNVGIIADPDDFLRGFQPGDIAIYKDFIKQKHWAWFVPPVVSTDTPSSVSTTVKEAAETLTADSAPQQVPFVDLAVHGVSRFFRARGWITGFVVGMLSAWVAAFVATTK